MAIGKVRYTQDTRFTPLHEEGNDVWALKIQETRMSDSGLYECQVSYHDDVEKKLKMPVRLIVLGKRPFLYYVSKETGWVLEKRQFLPTSVRWVDMKKSLNVLT